MLAERRFCSFCKMTATTANRPRQSLKRFVHKAHDSTDNLVALPPASPRTRSDGTLFRLVRGLNVSGGQPW